jgi:hypothetical protein
MRIRELYKTIQMFTELTSEFPEVPQDVTESLIKYKRELRRLLKEKNNLYYGPYENPIGEITFVIGDYDGCIIKVFVPDENWTDEEKREFISENWKEYQPSQYDCTGQIFTNWIKVINVPAGVVIYINERRDV